MDEHYIRRIGALPGQTRQMLTLAAADPTGDSALFWRAGLALGLDPAAAGAAESDQLLEVGSHIRFRHPLARSAAYAAGSDADRRAAHAALAAATDAHADPERRVWHLAIAATGPDETLAVELEMIAGAAQARGGIAAAAAVLQRSVRLTGPLSAGSTERWRRHPPIFTPASSTRRADCSQRLPALQPTISNEPGWSCSEDRSRTPRIPGPTRPRCSSTPRHGSSRSTFFWPAETYLDAWLASTVAGRTARPGERFWTCPSPRCRRAPTDKPRPCDLLLDALATSITSDRRTAAASLRQAMHAFLDEEVPDDEVHQAGDACLAHRNGALGSGELGHPQHAPDRTGSGLRRDCARSSSR